MKRSYVILSIGISLIVIGSIFLSLISIDVQEKYSSLVLIIPDETLEPQTSYTVAFDLFTAHDTTLVVASRTPNSFLTVRLVDEDGTEVFNTAFNKNILIPLDEFKIGSYDIIVTNLDERKISVNAIIVPGAMINQLEDFLSLAYDTLAASAIVFVGFIICLIGIIIFFLDRRKKTLV